jgi:hypothetical protein
MGWRGVRVVVRFWKPKSRQRNAMDTERDFAYEVYSCGPERRKCECSGRRSIYRGLQVLTQTFTRAVSLATAIKPWRRRRGFSPRYGKGVTAVLVGFKESRILIGLAFATRPIRIITRAKRKLPLAQRRFCEWRWRWGGRPSLLGAGFWCEGVWVVG